MKLKIYAIAVSILLIASIAVIITLSVWIEHLNNEYFYLNEDKMSIEESLTHTNKALNQTIGLQNGIFSHNIEYALVKMTTDFDYGDVTGINLYKDYAIFIKNYNSRHLIPYHDWEYRGLILRTNKNFTKYKIQIVDSINENYVTTIDNYQYDFNDSATSNIFFTNGGLMDTIVH
ncbi:MAG: hypothetical protein Kapaf2KO_10280 [Candidatus Kapaibacteriales bacterium]